MFNCENPIDYGKINLDENVRHNITKAASVVFTLNVTILLVYHCIIHEVTCFVAVHRYNIDNTDNLVDLTSIFAVRAESIFPSI